MARALCYDTFMQLLYTAMKNSKDEMLAAIAEKSLKEVNYHYRFSSEWVIRLGDGTPESKQKMQTAIDEIWNYTGEMFMPSNIDTEMMANGVAPDITALQAPWLQKIKEVLAEATLVLPESGWMHSGGKNGVHSEQMGFLLADLQYMQRAFPSAEW
jgi:ring-1,2-phenylacetyl-CoA epoxidase subunit PaaC